MQELTEKFFKDMFYLYKIYPEIINSSVPSYIHSYEKNGKTYSSGGSSYYKDTLKKSLNQICDDYSKLKGVEKEVGFIKEVIKLVDSNIEEIPLPNGSRIPKLNDILFERLGSAAIVGAVISGIVTAALAIAKPKNPKFYMPIAAICAICILAVPANFLLLKSQMTKTRSVMKSRAKKLADTFDSALSK